MGIRILSLPTSDLEFRDYVRATVRGICPHDDDPADLSVASERELRQALGVIRARYREVWIRRQDALASIDGVETWYVFRDESLVAEPAGASRH